jgi:hypothetical protein
MGQLLAALIADSETGLTANPAKLANLPSGQAKRFADSQDSQATEVSSSTAASLLAMRTRLLALADVELIDPAIVHALCAPDVGACAGGADDFLRAYLRALRDTDLRERGKVPEDETASALCRHCGSVWLHPAVAACAPVVNGWPRVLGCPWCHVENRRAIPRPRELSPGARTPQGSSYSEPQCDSALMDLLSAGRVQGR